MKMKNPYKLQVFLPVFRGKKNTYTQLDEQSDVNEIIYLN